MGVPAVCVNYQFKIRMVKVCLKRDFEEKIVD